MMVATGGYTFLNVNIDLIQNWQKCLANSGKIGGVLMDLSKAYECFTHDFLIAKLAVYGMGYHSFETCTAHHKARSSVISLAAHLKHAA